MGEPPRGTFNDSYTQYTVSAISHQSHGQKTGSEMGRDAIVSLGLVGFGTGAIVVLALLAAAALRCYQTWKVSRYEEQHDEEDGGGGKVRISHSLPDLTQDIARHVEYVQEPKEKKTNKVLRQTTLPTVPTRLQIFHRQLSQKLEMSRKDKAKDFATKSLELNAARKRNPQDSIGIIQPELYKRELLRQVSTESTDAEKVGTLSFTLKYDKELEALVVKVLQALDLPAKDMSGSSDPYIKIYLLPDRKKKFTTKVHRRNLNPAFNETFVFNAPYEDLEDRYLQFSVYDFDRFSRHDMIGQVLVKGMLDATDLTTEIDFSMDILAPPKDKLDLGELMVSLCYLPTAGRLTVTIIKARNLRAMDITGSSDPYTKVYLMCQGKKIRKRKTSVRKSCLFPVWNESLIFDVPSDIIQETSMVFKVVDYDRVGSNEIIGQSEAGGSCIGPGRDHWLEMLDNPRCPVTQWYPLLENLNQPVITGENNSPPDSPALFKGKQPNNNKGKFKHFNCLR